MSQTNDIYSRISENKHVKNIIYTDGRIEWVNVYFKEAYTTNTIIYNIPIKWTMDDVVNVVKQWVIEDLRLCCRNYDCCSISIIEMGQDIRGIQPEDCQPVEEEDITYYNKYIANNKWPGFYIKIN